MSSCNRGIYGPLNLNHRSALEHGTVLRNDPRNQASSRSCFESPMLTYGLLLVIIFLMLSYHR